MKKKKKVTTLFFVLHITSLQNDFFQNDSVLLRSLSILFQYSVFNLFIPELYRYQTVTLVWAFFYNTYNFLVPISFLLLYYDRSLHATYFLLALPFYFSILFSQLQVYISRQSSSGKNHFRSSYLFFLHTRKLTHIHPNIFINIYGNFLRTWTEFFSTRGWYTHKKPREEFFFFF